MTFRSLATAVAATTLLFAPGIAAEDNALLVLVSNGMKAAMEELRPQCERATGHPLALQFDSTAAAKKRIEAGEAFDVTILTSEAIEDLSKQGKLARASRADLARSELGIGIRAGVPRPDIRTAEAFKRTLREARSITYPRDGASRGYVEEMFEHMGIAGDMKSKVILAPSSGAATASVVAGNAALVITLFSEIVPIRGLEILGPLPGDFHYEIRFAAAASAATRHAEAAQALIAFLAGPKTASIYKAKGLEPR